MSFRTLSGRPRWPARTARTGTTTGSTSRRRSGRPSPTSRPARSSRAPRRSPSRSSTMPVSCRNRASPPRWIRASARKPASRRRTRTNRPPRGTTPSSRPTSASHRSRPSRATSRTRFARTSSRCRSRAAYPGREGKEKILETYLNLIYYGNGSYGIRAAAANYFGITDLADLTNSQAAFLAGLPQRPSFYDPYQNPNGEPGSEEAAADALARRDTVVDAMLAEGYLTQREARNAKNTTWLEMEPRRLTSILREPHFSFRVREEAERILGSLPGVTDGALAVRTGGYRIITTLDYELQQEAKRLVSEHVHSLNTSQFEEPGCLTPQGKACQDFNVNNGAMVAIDSPTGEIVSYVGSVDYYNREAPEVQGQYDVAGLGRRQPGSAFKPITYASAFKSRDATVSTMLVDAITEFGVDGADLVPAHERRHQGARAGPGARCAALLAEHPVGPDAVPRRRADDGRLRRVARHRQQRVHHGPGSRPLPGARIGPGQPHEHDPGLLDVRRSRVPCTRRRRSSRSATATTASSTPATTTARRRPIR